jgi:hypothetical protein
MNYHRRRIEYLVPVIANPLLSDVAARLLISRQRTPPQKRTPTFSGQVEKHTPTFYGDVKKPPAHIIFWTSEKAHPHIFCTSEN